ncbi:MAG: FmdB family transcriptional regulator [Bryobacterales bacterium]|jgi:putative FmdB family regulatory protein|nr:FmdB family transcriptional regulator [Bryobacterales bacterium]
MPLYDFQCLDCGERFEALVLKTAASCPSCQSARLEQLLSGFSVSSESTRDSNLSAAKRKHAKVHRDYSMDMHNAEKNHHH